jgi:ketose-bisphosphate aldolase
MTSVNCIDLLKHAQDNNYAVGYFEAWNLESLLAVVRAAEATRSPVMIGFCGEYLNNPERRLKEDLFLYGSIVKKIARCASVPVATLLNEAIDINMAYRGVKAGFDMVMFVDEHMPVEQLTPIQKNLVKFAHACDVAVEAEVGALGMSNQSTGEMQTGFNSDPDVAARFVVDTGVDALAVSIGNVHLLEGFKAKLDMDLLERLNQKVTVPLVLHGGTGIDKADFKPAIERGIAKVNVGAGLKRIVIRNEQQYFAENNVSLMNPNDILGKGGKLDINSRSYDAMMEEVIDFIQAFGGLNKAL